MTIEEAVDYVVGLGFSLEFEKANDFYVAVLRGYGTDFRGLGNSPSKAFCDAVNSLNHFAAVTAEEL